MKNVLKFEWNRMIRSKTLLVSVLVAAVMVIIDVMWWYNGFRNGVDVNISVIMKWLGVNPGVSSGIYFFTSLPLLTALAYSWTVSHDRSTGYVAQIITRVGRKKYYLSKYIVTFISGGIVFVSALVLDFMLLSTFSYMIQPWSTDSFMTISSARFGSEIFYYNIYLFALVWCCVAFLWGGAMACIGMAAGMITKNHIVASVVPFLIFMGETMLGAYITNNYLITIDGRALELTWTSMLYVRTAGAAPNGYMLGTIAAIIAVPTLVYFIRGRKYECL